MTWCQDFFLTLPTPCPAAYFLTRFFTCLFLKLGFVWRLRERTRLCWKCDATTREFWTSATIWRLFCIGKPKTHTSRGQNNNFPIDIDVQYQIWRMLHRQTKDTYIKGAKQQFYIDIQYQYHTWRLLCCTRTITLTIRNKSNFLFNYISLLLSFSYVSKNVHSYKN